MDIRLRSESFAVENRSWLGSAHGTEATRTITLDLSTFSSSDHYPDGHIPSGVVLGRITDTGLWGPYDNSAEDGRETAAGFLFNTTQVHQSTGNVGAPLLEHGMIRVDKLPDDHGLNFPARSDLAGRFTFR